MDRYLTVAEVTESARRLVSRFPGTGRLRRIGTSRAGRPILMLSVGHGPRHALAVAGPHPDEPVGGASALALAERVARGDRRSPATDPSVVTWDIVLCLDPDGAALSEAAGVTGDTGGIAGGIAGASITTGGIAGADVNAGASMTTGSGAGGPAGADAAPGTTAAPAPTLKSYYGAAYRPVAAEQPEWAPIAAGPIPESQALFQVIDERRPFIQCSLHSTDVGGSWVQLTGDLPELALPFAASAKELGVPLQHGTYDALYWDNPGPGVYVLPPPDGTDRLAAGSADIGRSTWCAPMRYGGVTAIVEVPMWAADSAEDVSPHPEPVRALRGLSALVRDGGRQVTAVLDKARGFLPPAGDDPSRRVLEWMADGLYDLVAESWEPLARQAAAASHENDPRRPTTAQVSALEIVARRQPLRAAGLLLRLLASADDPAAPGLRQELDGLFTAWCADFEQALGVRWIPVRDQVEHQTRTVTAAAEAALKSSR
ncbi:M14 family zinc carboxypeptidase [Streptomyces sp. NPDC005573]|uniref:M14 family zinc carboxypeptidase n=1 Tax=Streptomyces sp. NPDC005573 TaxID=3156890 RepID=UPI0033A817F9